MVARTEGERGRVTFREVRAFRVRDRIRAVRVRVRVRVIGIRDTEEGQLQRQMRFWKHGCWWRGSVAARALSAVGCNTFLLFIMPAWARGAAHYIVGRGGDEKGIWHK